MTELGKLIRTERKRRKMNRGDLAQAAQELTGAPDVTAWHVAQAETVRTTYKLDDPEDRLRWIVLALKLPAERVLRAMGMAA